MARMDSVEAEMDVGFQMNNNVVNLFERIRENPKRLARMLYMTPYARESDGVGFYI